MPIVLPGFGHEFAGEAGTVRGFAKIHRNLTALLPHLHTQHLLREFSGWPFSY